jgi:hypothetical protein
LKDPKQQGNFPSLQSLSGKLEDSSTGRRFPTFDYNRLLTNLGDRVSDTKRIIDSYEERMLGDSSNSQNSPTFYGILNSYKELYTTSFNRCLQEKVLEILNMNKGTDDYGKGSLKSALEFLNTLKDWYEEFVSKFNEVRRLYEQANNELINIDTRVNNFYNENMNKGKAIFPRRDFRVEYLKLRKLQNEKNSQELLGKVIYEIAQENLNFINFLIDQVKTWVNTFEKGKNRIEKAKMDLKDVRNEKRSIVVHKYLTESEDDYERRLYELIRYRKMRGELENYTGNDEKKLREKEIVEKLPRINWAELLEGFSWAFNIKDEEKGILQYPNYNEGELVCLVSKGIPEWPSPDRWDDEKYILTWNYQFIENYLKLALLNDISIGVIDILMWQDKEPDDIINFLGEKSLPFLDYEDNTHINIANKSNPKSSQIEYSRIISGDFSASSPYLKKWIDDFKNIINQNGWQISGGSAKEVAVIQFRHNLVPKAMPNLMNNREEYVKRMENREPPPLHVLPGQKRAFKYEVDISKEFNEPIEELHPLVVTLLEEEKLVRYFILGILFELIREETESDSRTGSPKNVLKLQDLELEEADIKEPFSFAKAIANLRFPPNNQVPLYKNALNKFDEEITQKRNERLKNKNEYKALLNSKIDELKTELGKLNSKLAKDIRKVFIVMLEEELNSLK